jgi:hypothetical protein
VQTLDRLHRSGIEPAGLRAYFDGVYKRQRILGFTLSKEITQVRYYGNSPVLRVEALYSFNQAFNTDGNRWGDLAWLSDRGIVEKDQIRYMIGFDWPIWIRKLNPRQTFFWSMQFFHFHILNYDKKLFAAPFYFDGIDSTGRAHFAPAVIHQDEYYWSLGLNSEWDNGRFKPDLLFAKDIRGEAYFVKFKINLNYTMHWRPEIGVMIYDGDPYHSFGLFDNKDQVYIKIRYQF